MVPEIPRRIVHDRVVMLGLSTQRCKLDQERLAMQAVVDRGILPVLTSPAEPDRGQVFTGNSRSLGNRHRSSKVV